MRNRYWTTLLGTILAFALSSVSEAGIERNVVGGTETIECGGESVEVNGASSDLTLLGDCPHVEINGSSNTVRIEQARHIEINGMGNTVVWERGSNGKRPSIDNSGVGNTARQGRVAGSDGAATAAATTAAGAATASKAPSKPETAPRSGRSSAITIQEDGRTQTLACAGKDVTVDGNSNDLSLTGECGRVEVSGNDNVVHVAVAAAISALGNGNRITWGRGAGGQAPKVTNLGVDNDVAQTTK